MAVAAGGLSRGRRSRRPVRLARCRNCSTAIGAQTATLRRSIDRLWENQSIETCDDWVIPYIGDLLATRLVSCLDARAQRLDVAKTIYYRRRAGTLGLLEELVADIAGRDARAVEFFRRLGRTRHQFDPADRQRVRRRCGAVDCRHDLCGRGHRRQRRAMPMLRRGRHIRQPQAVRPAAASASQTGGVIWNFDSPLGALAPAVIEGLGRRQFAHARRAASPICATPTPPPTPIRAFDEFAHTADLRAGVQSFGWYNISHLGVFVWWLHSFPIAARDAGQQRPVASPMLHLRSERAADSAVRAQLAHRGELRRRLGVAERMAAAGRCARGAVERISRSAVSGGVLSRAWRRRSARDAAAQDVLIHPESGLFSFVGSPAQGEIVTQYRFGFMSRIGAGGFPYALLETIALPATIATAKGGGTALADGARASNGDATVEIDDSLTYPGLAFRARHRRADPGVDSDGRAAADDPLDGGGATWTINGNRRQSAHPGDLAARRGSRADGQLRKRHPAIRYARPRQLRRRRRTDRHRNRWRATGSGPSMGRGQHHHPDARALHNRARSAPGAAARSNNSPRPTASFRRSRRAARQRITPCKPRSARSRSPAAPCLGHARSTGWTPANASSMTSRSPRTLSTAASASAPMRAGSAAARALSLGDRSRRSGRSSCRAASASLTTRGSPAGRQRDHRTSDRRHHPGRRRERFGNGRLPGRGSHAQEARTGSEVRGIRAARVSIRCGSTRTDGT